MIHIHFTASIIKLDKGSYVARAAEFPVTTEPASTQRGALKKLKANVLGHLRSAAADRRLAMVLDRAGYNPDLLSFPGTNIRPFVIDTLAAVVSLPHRRLKLPKGYRRTNTRALH